MTIERGSPMKKSPWRSLVPSVVAAGTGSAFVAESALPDIRFISRDDLNDGVRVQIATRAALLAVSAANDLPSGSCTYEGERLRFSLTRQQISQSV